MSGAGITGKSVVLRCVPPGVVGREKALAGEVQGSPISVLMHLKPLVGQMMSVISVTGQRENQGETRGKGRRVGSRKE